MRNLIDKIQIIDFPKKISSLLISAFLFSPINFLGYSNPNINPNSETEKQEKSKKIIPYNLLPKEFKQKIENYTTKGVRIIQPVRYYDGRLFKLIRYDVDSDGKQDVVEFYRVTSYKDLGLGKEIEYEYASKPVIYCFNWRNDEEIEEETTLNEDEVLIDEEEDGLNNSENEYWLDTPSPNKINKKKKGKEV